MQTDLITSEILKKVSEDLYNYFNEVSKDFFRFMVNHTLDCEKPCLVENIAVSYNNFCTIHNKEVFKPEPFGEFMFLLLAHIGDCENDICYIEDTVDLFISNTSIETTIISELTKKSKLVTESLKKRLEGLVRREYEMSAAEDFDEFDLSILDKPLSKNDIN